jgi:hypothetical protein
MAQAQQTRDQTVRGQSENLTDSPMMAHLLQALKAGTDVGHYGRLVFVMVAQWFMDDDEMIGLLAKQPDHDEEEARRLVAQVKARGYNPPKREKILAWQQEQDFPICPDAADPGSCNVYAELKFPDEVYENIGEFWEEKVEASR